MSPRIAQANTIKDIFCVAAQGEGTKDSGSLSEFKKWSAVSKNVKAATIHWQDIERRKSYRRARRSIESTYLFSAEY